MQYFDASFFKFFDTLAKNNNKEWFDDNRSTYENKIKVPFRKLVEDVTAQLSKDLPELNRDASKAIFRINKDVRFSKDKSPYKTNVAAVISRNGKKDEMYPGFYMHFGSDEIMIGGGKYFCSKEDITKIRQEIYYNPKEFQKIITAKKFIESFGVVQGDKSKILEPDYKAFLAEQPLIANKQFWFYRNLNREEITSDQLDKLVASYFKSAIPFNQWLLKTISE